MREVVRELNPSERLHASAALGRHGPRRRSLRTPAAGRVEPRNARLAVIRRGAGEAVDVAGDAIRRRPVVVGAGPAAASGGAEGPGSRASVAPAGEAVRRRGCARRALPVAGHAVCVHPIVVIPLR